MNSRAYILDRPNSIELSPCDFQPLRFLPRFASLSLLTGGVFANILTISVKPLSSFDGFGVSILSGEIGGEDEFLGTPQSPAGLRPSALPDSITLKDREPGFAFWSYSDLL
jgi:hypothetical protein